MTDDGRGDLPPGWAWTTLGDVGEWAGGGTPSKSRPEFWANGSIPWVSPKDMKVNRITETQDHITAEAVESSATRLLAPGAVVVVVRSGILRRTLPVATTGVPVTLNQDMKGVVPRKHVAPDYLAFALRCYNHDILDTCTKSGTTVDNIEFPAFLRFGIPLPPLPEQHRIVAAIEEQFTRLDAAVAALERARANLKRYRAAVLAAACSGRLVPTEAALARADGRDYEPAERLLARILAERRAAPRKGRARDEPAPPDTAGLPELPEGWCWASWLLVGRSQNGRAFPSSEYQDYGVKLLRPGNLYDDGYVRWTPKNTRHLPEEWADRFPDYVVGPDELIMNLTAQSLKDDFLGRTCMTGATERCLLNQRLARLTPVGIAPRYALWLLKSQVFRSFVASLNTGSLIQHMFTSQLDGFVFPLPPLAEQQRIVAEVERRLSVVEEQERAVARALARAATLRQAILRRAFAGKLVPQDPRDEPASVLQERIRQERAAAGDTARPRRGRAKEKTATAKQGRLFEG